MSKKIALKIDTPALGDTLAAIPTLRKLCEAYESSLTVFTSKPFLFENHPLVKEALPLDSSTEGYKVYTTFSPLVGKHYNLNGQKTEFRYSNYDFRQYHAASLGFDLTPDEMEIDIYIEKPRPLNLGKYVMIHPTHTWATRTWDQKQWQGLVDLLNDKGIPVVAIGRDSSEVGFYNIQKPAMDINIKLGLNLLNDPDNDPSELRWMMKNEASMVVTMDSGILHLAGTTDVHILQLGSSIHPKLRAPWRKGSQMYKYDYVIGSCEEFCSSNMKYNIKEWGDIMGVPPQVKCLANKPTFECHPSYKKVYNKIIEKL